MAENWFVIWDVKYKVWKLSYSDYREGGISYVEAQELMYSLKNNQLKDKKGKDNMINCHLCNAIVKSSQNYKTWYFQGISEAQPLCPKCYGTEADKLAFNGSEDVVTESLNVSDLESIEPMKAKKHKAQFVKSLDPDSTMKYLKGQYKISSNFIHWQVSMKELNRDYGYCGDFHIPIEYDKEKQYIQAIPKTLRSLAAGSMEYKPLQVRYDLTSGTLRFQLSKGEVSKGLNRDYGACLIVYPTHSDKKIVHYLVDINLKHAMKG